MSLIDDIIDMQCEFERKTGSKPEELHLTRDNYFKLKEEAERNGMGLDVLSKGSPKFNGMKIVLHVGKTEETRVDV